MIDVLMSVRDAENYLAPSIESILNQTYKNFVFYIIDDASDDGSLKIIKSFHDKRIVLFQNKKPQGYTKNLNFLLKAGKNEFVARHDADDIARRTRFQKEIEFLTKNKLDIVGSNAVLIDEYGKKVGKHEYRGSDIDKDLFKKNIFIHSSILMRRSIFNKLKEYSLEHPFSEDYELWLRARAAGYKLGIIREPLLDYRVHPASVSMKYLKVQQIAGIKARVDNIRNRAYPWYYLLYLIPVCLSSILPENINKYLRRFFIKKTND